MQNIAVGICFFKKHGPLDFACTPCVPEPDLKVMQCTIMKSTGIFKTPVFVTLASNILIYSIGIWFPTLKERLFCGSYEYAFKSFAAHEFSFDFLVQLKGNIFLLPFCPTQKLSFRLFPLFCRLLFYNMVDAGYFL